MTDTAVIEKQKIEKKKHDFLVMINFFESAKRTKLSKDQIDAYWHRLKDYPSRYFIRVIEIVDDLKFFPEISDIVDRFYEYSLSDANQTVKLTEPKDRQKEVSRKWMAQIKTIISPRYAGNLQPDFDWRLLGKLYEPDKLKELLDKNLKEAGNEIFL
jgi:hypothetical protein